MADSVGGSVAVGTFPALPYEAWEESKETLHRYAQVVGKVRLRYALFANHWWHVPLYVGAHGLTTSPIPYGDKAFDLVLDLLDNRLVASTSEGGRFAFPLDDLPIAEFYGRLMDGLRSLGIDVSINTKPFDLPDDHTLDKNVFHCVCDREYVRRYFHALTRIDSAFKEFAGRFNGKQSPVQLYWHSFDLAVTRFSGRRAPEREGADPVTKEAYSHEVISFGFWPGDRTVREPTSYSYIAPEPDGLTDQPLKPEADYSAPEGGTALLSYDAVRDSDSPREAPLDFMQSAYEAGAKTGGWDMEGFRTHPPD